MTQAGGAVIDQQKEPKRERPGMAWALRSLYRPSAKSALAHHRLGRDGGAACRRPCALRGRLPPGVPFLPSMDRPADANGGLCVGQSFADALGAWGLSAPNKLRRVYTGALPAFTVRACKKGLNIVRIGGIFCSCQFNKSEFFHEIQREK